mgnify:CR=1 FL=1
MDRNPLRKAAGVQLVSWSRAAHQNFSAKIRSRTLTQINLYDLDIKLFKNGQTLGFLLGWAEDRSSAILRLDLQSLTTSEMLVEKSEILKFMVC